MERHNLKCIYHRKKYYPKENYYIEVKSGIQISKNPYPDLQIVLAFSQKSEAEEIVNNKSPGDKYG